MSLVRSGKGGKAKGKGYKGKGWDSQKGQSKGKGKAGKGSKGDNKGKGKGAFNGNCHNCGVWGHRIADCPEPRQQQGVRYVSEYYQPSTSQLTFMVTDHAATQVDYRRPWNSVGKSGVRVKPVQMPSQTDDTTSNMFEALSVDVKEHGNSSIEHVKLVENEFPVPMASSDFTRRQRMPKLPPRKTQFARNACMKSSCDAEMMPKHEFNKIIREFGSGDAGCCEKPFVHENMDTQNPPKQIAPESKDKLLITEEYYSKTAMQDMASRMMSNLQKRDLSVSAALMDDARRQINLITATQPEGEVLNVQQEMVWVQVPCAVDSGACANVAPEDIFEEMPKDAPKLDPKYFAADGSPIAHLGSLTAEGVSEEGMQLKIDFDLGKVTRPLLSVFKMTAAGHKVQFEEHGGTIQVKGSHKKIKLRQEGRLYMLDLWCRVPAKLAASSPFIRQVAKA